MRQTRVAGTYISMELWSSMAFVRAVVMAAAARGADYTDFCRALGLTPAQLEDPGARAGLDSCIRVFEEAVARTGDPLFGLHLGQQTTPAVAGMVGFLMQSSADLFSAIEHAVEFNKTYSNVSIFTMDVRGDEVHYGYEPANLWQRRSPESARQVVDESFSAAVHFSKMLTGRAVYPLRVRMRAGRPRDVNEYVRIFKTEPEFGQDCNCMIYRRRDLALPVLGHNPELNRMFRALLEQELSKVERQETLAAAVRRTVLQQFDTSLPQLPEVVAALHLSPRTLQRKLREEGVTFQAIVESVKRELATGLLRDSDLTVNEIAYRLGYAEPSVFRRAFKKWTGTTPKVFKT